MRTAAPVPVLAIAVALASCATRPPASNLPPPYDPVQSLEVRTVPAGAACSVSRNGVVVASVDPTPGNVGVARKTEPIDVVCRLGELEQRMTFAPVAAYRVAGVRDRPPPSSTYEPNAGEMAGLVAADIAVQSVAFAFPPAGFGIALGMLAIAAATSPVDAFQPLPTLVLAPASFESEAARDTYFVLLRARLEADAEARRTLVGQSCTPWPCSPTEPRCSRPTCVDMLAVVSADLASELDQIPALRARARIVPAPQPQSTESGTSSN
jgi:hypothetical protein